MPRPRKWRRVCCLPRNTGWTPLCEQSNSETVVMTIDEFETIRLMDLENLTQEVCAERMNVARTTVQLIYHTARAKLADALVNARKLKIEGGDYEVCPERLDGCGGCQYCHCCQRATLSPTSDKSQE